MIDDDPHKTAKSFTGDDLPSKIIYTTRSHNCLTTRIKNLITKQTLKQKYIEPWPTKSNKNT